MSSNTKNRNQQQRYPPQRNDQQQTNTTPKIKEAPTSPEDENVSRFKELLPQFKQATPEEIKEIFKDFNNNFEAAVNAALNGTLTVKPPPAWEKVGQVKKKKKTNAQQKPQRYQKNFNKTESDDPDKKGSRGPNTSQSNYKSDNRQQGRGPRGDQNKNPQNKQQSAAKPTPAPSSAATGALQQPPPVAAPVVTPTGTSPPTEPPVNQPTTSTPTPQSAPPTSTVTPTTINTKLTYANVAKSRKPWKPTTSSGAQTTSESPQQSESREEPSSTPTVTETVSTTHVIVSPTPVSPPHTQTPPQPIVQQPEPEIETRDVPQPAPTVVSPPQQPAQPQPTQQAPPQPTQPQVQQTQPPVQPQTQQAPQQPQQEKQPRGVLLPGSFGNDDNMQFQFGNLGINYDEELIHSDNLSNVGEPLKNQGVPKHVAQKLANEQMNNLVMQGELDPEIQHAPLYQPYMVPFHGYDPASEPGAPRGSPMGPYYDTQFQYRDNTKYRGSNQNYSQRDSANSKFAAQDSTGVNPTGTSSQAGAQTPPYFSHPVFYPGMVLPQAYASAYQSSQFNYPYAFSKYPNFGSFQPGSNMYTGEEDFKGYRGPQQSMYYPEPISRDGKTQGTAGAQSNPKPTTAGQGNKAQNFSGSQQEGTAQTAPSGNFKNTQQNADAYYARDFSGMGGNSFIGQYPPYLAQPQIIQGQPTGAPYQGPRNNNNNY